MIETIDTGYLIHIQWYTYSTVYIHTDACTVYINLVYTHTYYCSTVVAVYVIVLPTPSMGF